VCRSLNPPDSGNLLASSNAVLQTRIAASHAGNYALALAWVTAASALAIVIITVCGKEAKGVVLGERRSANEI